MKWRTIIPFLLAAAIVAGCRIEPPLHLRQAMHVMVKVIWKAEIYPHGFKPSGVSLYFFRDGEFYMRHTTSQVDSCLVSLEPGNYRLYMISQSPEEYGTLFFSDMENFEKAMVTAEETKSSWYTRADDEVLITNPEAMLAGVSDEFEVTAEQITTKADDSQPGLVSYYTVRVPVYPKSIVSQYWVTIYSDNADVLKAIRCSNTGMARSFLLTRDITADDEATQLISYWSLTMDDPINRVGHIDGKITTFGFPRGELPGPERDPTMNVATLLVDNKTVDHYTFNVGNLITLEEPPDGYRSVYRLILGSVAEPAIHPPDVHPADDASGLDALVNGWDNGEDVEVEM